MSDLTPKPPTRPDVFHPYVGIFPENIHHCLALQEARDIIEKAVPHLVGLARMMGHGEEYGKVAHLLKDVDAFYREQERGWATGAGWRSVGMPN